MTDEERALWDVYVQTGRPTDIRNKLVMMNRGIAMSVFNRYTHNFGKIAEQDDMEQELMITLFRCVENYDPHRASAKFSVYAYVACCKRMINEIRTNHTLRRSRVKNQCDKEMLTFESKCRQPIQDASLNEFYEMLPDFLTKPQYDAFMESSSRVGCYAMAKGSKKDKQRSTHARTKLRRVAEDYLDVGVSN